MDEKGPGIVVRSNFSAGPLDVCLRDPKIHRHQYRHVGLLGVLGVERRQSCPAPNGKIDNVALILPYQLLPSGQSGHDLLLGDVA
jgi:hypothetical protein